MIPWKPPRIKSWLKVRLKSQASPIITPKLFPDAKQDITHMDVLVCGECHEVFHYIEAFQEHKVEGVCTKVSTLHENTSTDQKNQVWGFLLWKNAKFKSKTDNEPQPSSWSVYQSWCNLEVTEKDTWIAAGQSLLAAYKIGTAKVQDTNSASCQVQALRFPYKFLCLILQS